MFRSLLKQKVTYNLHAHLCPNAQEEMVPRVRPVHSSRAPGRTPHRTFLQDRLGMQTPRPILPSRIQGQSTLRPFINVSTTHQSWLSAPNHVLPRLRPQVPAGWPLNSLSPSGLPSGGLQEGMVIGTADGGNTGNRQGQLGQCVDSGIPLDDWLLATWTSQLVRPTFKKDCEQRVNL